MVEFRRWPAVVLTAALVGCSPGHYGKGPLTLSPEVQACYNQYKSHEFSGYFAVSIDGKSCGYSYCPWDYCTGNSIRIAIQACEANSVTECKTYAVGERIVWDGPVTQASKVNPSSPIKSSRGKGTSSVQTRPIAVEWEGYVELIAGIIGYREADRGGVVRMQLPSNDGQCTGNYQLFGHSEGTWSVACTNGLAASGTFKGFGAGKGASGSGTDVQGRKVRWTVGAAN